MKDLSGAASSPGHVLERRGHGEIEAPADGIGQRDVKQVEIINNFSSLRRTLGLLLRANEVSMGTLFTQTKRDLPAPAIEKTRIVRPRTFTACALHANHGRALTCGHSTLRPGMWAGPEETGEDQQRRDEPLFVGNVELLKHSTCFRVPANSFNWVN